MKTEQQKTAETILDLINKPELYRITPSGGMATIARGNLKGIAAGNVTVGTEATLPFFTQLLDTMSTAINDLEKRGNTSDYWRSGSLPAEQSKAIIQTRQLLNAAIESAAAQGMFISGQSLGTAKEKNWAQRRNAAQSTQTER